MTGPRIGADPRASWPAERVDRLKALHAQGLSYSQIAEALNTDRNFPAVTRNAISGKLDRLRIVRSHGSRTVAMALSHRNVSSVRRHPKPEPKPRAQAKVFGATRVKPALIFAGPGAVMSAEPKLPFHGKADAFSPLPGVEPVPFLERTGPRCRWPVGGAGDQMLCCGALAHDRSYCQAHHERAHQTDQGKKPSAKELARSLRRYVA